MTQPSKISLPDGIELAYEVLGSEHLGKATPIVFISGMTSCRNDWERLSSRISQNRPVLIYDHRGMGDSTYREDDKFTIESLTRDLIFILKFLGWKKLAICGHSMGGVIAQQLLLLPYHATEPTPLPFSVTHVVLAATFPAVIRDPRYGVKFAPKPPGPIPDNIKKRIIRESMVTNFDPDWFADERNQARINWLVENAVVGRPFPTIEKQLQALSRFKFRDLHSKLSPNTHILIIHGQLDQILPFSSVDAFLKVIPHARVAQVGNRPGEIPSSRFGHNWIEYFDAQVWYDVVEVFLGSGGITARL